MGLNSMKLFRLVHLPKIDSFRQLSTAHVADVSQKQDILSDTEKQEFMATFPTVVEQVIPEDDYIKRHVINLLYGTALNGKLNGGFATIATCKMLQMPEDAHADRNHMINILGWCTELIATSTFITDDIIDCSESRRGKPCWYKNPEVGLRAIKDAEIINHAVFFILKKYFSHLPCYVSLLELFQEAVTNTYLGQTLDTMIVKEGKSSLESFTSSRHTALGRYRFAYTFFKLPVVSGIHFSNKFDAIQQKHVETILYDLGYFSQVQNDILDCYGDSTKTGKIGNDIHEAKCTWLVVTALQRASRAQRRILEKNYGKQDPKCEEAVRELYHELGLLNLYKDFKNKVVDATSKQIIKISDERLQRFFEKFVAYYVNENEHYFVA